MSLYKLSLFFPLIFCLKAHLPKNTGLLHLGQFGIAFLVKKLAQKSTKRVKFDQSLLHRLHWLQIFKSPTRPRGRKGEFSRGFAFLRGRGTRMSEQTSGRKTDGRTTTCVYLLLLYNFDVILLVNDLLRPIFGPFSSLYFSAFFIWLSRRRNDARVCRGSRKLAEPLADLLKCWLRSNNGEPGALRDLKSLASGGGM